MTLEPATAPRRGGTPGRIATGIGPNLRSFRWATGQIRSIHRRLPSEGVRARVPLATGMGPRGWWGVRAAVKVMRPTCLERALVVQAWVGGYTDVPDVVIAVRNESSVEAHAWIDGPDPYYDPSYAELTRLAYDAG